MGSVTMVTMVGPYVDNTELQTSLLITPEPNPAYYEVIYSVYVPNLQPTDVVLIRAQFEVTNNTGQSVSLGRYLIRTNSATSVNGTDYVCRAMSTTFPSDRHHEAPLMVGVDTGMPVGNYYYNVVAYASSSGSNHGQSLVVEQGYGSCNALVFDTP